MLIHSITPTEETNTNTNLELEEEKNICGICYEDIEENEVSLKCNHKYHYDCILLIYKNTKKGYKTLRKCPYCRSDGGYLELIPGRAPLKDIHREYKNKDTLQIQYIPNKCNYILKRGKNVGNQCSLNIKKGLYCTRHYKMMNPQTSLPDSNSLEPVSNDMVPIENIN